jgi:hypothetical protein
MGIDIYTKWKYMTKAEEKKQFTGFSAVSGQYGYLREAYHGEPYATRILLPEAFKKSEWVKIPAARLKSRLPSAMHAALVREKVIYKNKRATLKSPVVQAFAKFVAFIEKLEKAGKQPEIHASY